MKIATNCIEEFPLIQKGVNEGIFCVESEGLHVLRIEERNSDQSWDDFVSTFPDDKCCHIFSHFKYTSESDNVDREKFVHILWAPSKAPRKDKMQLSFFAQNVLTELGALGACRIEAGSKQSLDYNQTREKILRRVTVK